MGVIRLEPRAGKCLIHIACDRAGFIQPKPDVLEGGDFAEWVSRPVLGWCAFRSEDIDRDKLVRDALFFQGKTDSADIDTIWCTIESRNRFL
jgi:hypothetical protein